MRSQLITMLTGKDYGETFSNLLENYILNVCNLPYIPKPLEVEPNRDPHQEIGSFEASLV